MADLRRVAFFPARARLIGTQYSALQLLIGTTGFLIFVVWPTDEMSTEACD